MDTKHIHCMLEDMAEYGKEMISCAVGSGNVNLDDAGKIIDIVKDLAEAEYRARLAKCLRKEDEEEEAEEKYMLRMLKDEYKDEYKEMKERYGDDADRRFYDNYRYKSSGRFAPRGRGSYMPRRGYEEPPYYRMMPEDYKAHDAEWYRDLDRKSRNVMYYTPMTSGNAGGQSANPSSGGNTGDNVRGYSDGYADGMRDGRSSQSRDRREGRSGQMRRGYMETKEANKDNSPESKQKRMKELDVYMNELNEDMKELITDMAPEERAIVKQKVAKLATLV